MNEPKHHEDCKRLSASGQFIFPKTDCSCGSIRYGSFALDGWAGRLVQRIGIIGETPKRYRILALTHTTLGGRARSIQPGETALIPKHAIRFEGS